MGVKEYSFENEVVNNKSLPPADVIKDVAELTGLSQLVVKDVINAYTSVAIRETVINGRFKWPGVCIINRTKVDKPTRKYMSNEDVTIELPCDFRISSKVISSLRQLCRDYTNGLIAKENGVEYEDWYKPYIILEGHDENDNASKITINNQKKNK